MIGNRYVTLVRLTAMIILGLGFTCIGNSGVSAAPPASLTRRVHDAPQTCQSPVTGFKLYVSARDWFCVSYPGTWFPPRRGATQFQFWGPVVNHIETEIQVLQPPFALVTKDVATAGRLVVRTNRERGDTHAHGWKGKIGGMNVFFVQWTLHSLYPPKIRTVFVRSGNTIWEWDLFSSRGVFQHQVSLLEMMVKSFRASLR